MMMFVETDPSSCTCLKIGTYFTIYFMQVHSNILNTVFMLFEIALLVELRKIKVEQKLTSRACYVASKSVTLPISKIFLCYLFNL